MLAGVSLDAEASSSTKMSVYSSNQSNRSCDGLPSAVFFFFGMKDGCQCKDRSSGTHFIVMEPGHSTSGKNGNEQNAENIRRRFAPTIRHVFTNSLKHGRAT